MPEIFVFAKIRLTYNETFFNQANRKVSKKVNKGVKMGVTLTILAYNEAENLVNLLPLVIENLKKVTDDYELLIVDSDKSEDNTKEVCEKFGAKYIVQESPYYIGAYKTAIKFAQKENFFIMDADFSHAPDSIPDIYNAFINNNADVAIGSRYVDGGINDDEAQNIVYSKFLNFIYQNLFGLKGIEDISGGFKMYKTEILKNINFMSRYFEAQLEILVKAKIQNPNLKVVEVPIHFQKRDKGVTKRNYFTFLPEFCLLFIKLLAYKFYKTIFKKH